jgi:hypothetical protein
MSDTFERVVKHFEAAEMLFKADPEGESIWAVLPGNHGSVTIFVKVEDEAMEVVAHHPLRIPENKRAALAELITRIGPRNIKSRLEMDYDEGKLMTRSRICFDPECGLVDEGVFFTIGVAVCALDCVHPAVMAILHQGKTAAEAARAFGEEGESEPPHANRFNLPKPEGNVPWEELPEDKLPNN